MAVLYPHFLALPSHFIEPRPSSQYSPWTHAKGSLEPSPATAGTTAPSEAVHTKAVEDTVESNSFALMAINAAFDDSNNIIKQMNGESSVDQTNYIMPENIESFEETTTGGQSYKIKWHTVLPVENIPGPYLTQTKEISCEEETLLSDVRNRISFALMLRVNCWNVN